MANTKFKPYILKKNGMVYHIDTPLQDAYHKGRTIYSLNDPTGPIRKLAESESIVKLRKMVYAKQKQLLTKGYSRERYYIASSKLLPNGDHEWDSTVAEIVIDKSGVYIDTYKGYGKIRKDGSVLKGKWYSDRMY